MWQSDSFHPMFELTHDLFLCPIHDHCVWDSPMGKEQQKGLTCITFSPDGVCLLPCIPVGVELDVSILTVGCGLCPQHVHVKVTLEVMVAELSVISPKPLGKS